MLASYQGAAVAIDGSAYVNRNVNGRVGVAQKVERTDKGVPIELQRVDEWEGCIFGVILDVGSDPIVGQVY